MYNRNLPPIKSVERPKKGSLVFGNVKSQEYAKKLENVKNEIIIEVPIKDTTDQTTEKAKPKLIFDVPTRNTTEETPDQTPEETPGNESIIEEFEDIEKTEEFEDKVLDTIRESLKDSSDPNYDEFPQLTSINGVKQIFSEDFRKHLLNKFYKEPDAKIKINVKDENYKGLSDDDYIKVKQNRDKSEYPIEYKYLFHDAIEDIENRLSAESIDDCLKIITAVFENVIKHELDLIDNTVFKYTTDRNIYYDYCQLQKSIPASKINDLRIIHSNIFNAFRKRLNQDFINTYSPPNLKIEMNDVLQLARRIIYRKDVDKIQKSYETSVKLFLIYKIILTQYDRKLEKKIKKHGMLYDEVLYPNVYDYVDDRCIFTDSKVMFYNSTSFFDKEKKLRFLMREVPNVTDDDIVDCIIKYPYSFKKIAFCQKFNNERIDEIYRKFIERFTEICNDKSKSISKQYGDFIKINYRKGILEIKDINPDTDIVSEIIKNHINEVGPGNVCTDIYLKFFKPQTITTGTQNIELKEIDDIIELFKKSINEDNECKKLAEKYKNLNDKNLKYIKNFYSQIFIRFLSHCPRQHRKTFKDIVLANTTYLKSLIRYYDNEIDNTARKLEAKFSSLINKNVIQNLKQSVRINFGLMNQQKRYLNDTYAGNVNSELFDTYVAVTRIIPIHQIQTEGGKKYLTFGEKFTKLIENFLKKEFNGKSDIILTRIIEVSVVKALNTTRLVVDSKKSKTIIGYIDKSKIEYFKDFNFDTRLLNIESFNLNYLKAYGRRVTDGKFTYLSSISPCSYISKTFIKIRYNNKICALRTLTNKSEFSNKPSAHLINFKSLPISLVNDLNSFVYKIIKNKVYNDNDINKDLKKLIVGSICSNINFEFSRYIEFDHSFDRNLLKLPVIFRSAPSKVKKDVDMNHTYLYPDILNRSNMITIRNDDGSEENGNVIKRTITDRVDDKVKYFSFKEDNIKEVEISEQPKSTFKNFIIESGRFPERNLLKGQKLVIATNTYSVIEDRGSRLITRNCNTNDNDIAEFLKTFRCENVHFSNGE